MPGVTGAGLASAPTESLPSTLPATTLAAASSPMRAASSAAAGRLSMMSMVSVPPAEPPGPATVSAMSSVLCASPGWCCAAFRA